MHCRFPAKRALRRTQAPKTKGQPGEAPKKVLGGNDKQARNENCSPKQAKPTGTTGMMFDTMTNHNTTGAIGLKPIRETLADRLRRARKQRGWSQEYLASRADTSQAVIQKIENGKSLRPRNIERIAKALDVRPAWLMFGVTEVEDLDEEAVQVARAWSRLKEPERSAMKETIRRLADG